MDQSQLKRNLRYKNEMKQTEMAVYINMYYHYIYSHDENTFSILLN